MQIYRSENRRNNIINEGEKKKREIGVGKPWREAGRGSAVEKWS